MGILQARILECFAMPSSRGSSQPRDRTQCLLCLLHLQWVLYHERHMGVKVKVAQHVQLFETPWTVASQGWLHGNSAGQNTGLCSHSHLQGIFPTEEMNPGLLHWRQILYLFNHQGNHCHPGIPLNRVRKENFIWLPPPLPQVWTSQWEETPQSGERRVKWTSVLIIWSNKNMCPMNIYKGQNSS